MSRIMKPMMSPAARVIALSGATLWLVASIFLSATPDGAGAAVVEELEFQLRLTVVDRFDGAPGLLYMPRAYLGRDGSMYVVDEGNGRVLKISSDDPHRAQTVFGAAGQGPGELAKPRSATADASGNVFVADVALGRISKFAPDGTLITTASLPRVASVAVNSQGEVLAYPGRGGALLQKFSNDLQQEEPLRQIETIDARRQRTLNGTKLAIDPQDRLFLLDQEALVVRVYDADYQPIGEWSVAAPGLREEVAARRERRLARNPRSRGGTNPILSMALDPSGGQLALLYWSSDDEGETWDTNICIFNVDGSLERIESRIDQQKYSVALDALGNLVETDAEEVSFWGLQPTRSGDN